MVAPTDKFMHGLDIEKLKAENRLLKAQTQHQQMEIDFLKKLDEIERR